MKKHLINLFLPHHGNNHKARILHHKSLSKLVMLLLLCQLIIFGITQVKPGVLGYASNISVDAIVKLTNDRRQTQGLDALKVNNKLSESAKEKAQDMFAKNYWAHNAPDGTTPWYFFKNVGYNYLYAGENLARDFGESSQVIQAWMDSPTHRDNIISGRYTEIGVAVVNGLLNGQETTLVVQHFGRASAVAAAIPAEAASDAAIRGAKANVSVSNTPLPVVETNPEIAVVEPLNNQMPAIANTAQQFAYSDTGVLASPQFSAFDITKSVNIALAAVVLVVLALDAFLIWHRKTTRRSGKSFAHLSLFAIIVMIIILTTHGRII
jgi:hypothetical protein